MDEALKDETRKLERSWNRHDSDWLRDYLVAGVEDPRINLASIFSRHALLWMLAGARYEALMNAEYDFSAALNWWLRVLREGADAEALCAVLFALRRGADNAEGIPLPHYLRRIFHQLPRVVNGVPVPNYLEALLSTRLAVGGPPPDQNVLNTFCALWRGLLDRDMAASGAAPNRRTEERLCVLEPACGSANDYRFLEACGLASRLNYTGFDLSEKNIANARRLFPHVRFDVGNVFEIRAPDQAFDLCIVHDLFEHLSPPGLEVALREVGRVTRRRLCLGFFNMDEIPEHEFRPVDEYHWNTLSRARVCEALETAGFRVQVLYASAFLRERTGCDQAHNPNACTLLADRVRVETV